MTLPRDGPRVASHALDRPQDTFLGRSYGAQLAPGQSGFHLLPSGQEAFLVRAALAASAERTLDLQYYIVAADATATLLLYRALRAAERGVRVRLLLDDLDAVGRDAEWSALALHPNVQVRVFNPFALRLPLGVARVLEYLGDGERLNRRMHNKLWIADNAAAVVGGRNLGDAYFAASGESDFADMDVLAAGPVVADVSRSFDEYWNSEWAVPVAASAGDEAATERLARALAAMAGRAESFRDSTYARALRSTDLGRMLRAGTLALTPARATAVYEAPGRQSAAGGSEADRITPVLRQMVQPAQREAILISPYFVPSERGVGTLCGLARRGVRVRVLTNSLASTDVPVVHAGYARYRPSLLACGVALHEMRPAAASADGSRPRLSSGTSLHAKAVIVDRSSILLGSMNLDPRSRRLNTEIALRIDSPALGAQLGALFDEAVSLEQSFRVELSAPEDVASALVWTGIDEDGLRRYDREPLASAWRRFVSGFLGALAPEELL